jgi:hypothetical protein
LDPNQARYQPTLRPDIEATSCRASGEKAMLIFLSEIQLGLPPGLLAPKIISDKYFQTMGL